MFMPANAAIAINGYSQSWNRYGRWTYKKSLPRDVVGVEFENRSAKATKVRCLIRGGLQKKITGRKAGWYRSCVMWWAPPREVVSSNLLGSKRPYMKARIMTCTESLDEFMICELAKESVCSMIPKKLQIFQQKTASPQAIRRRLRGRFQQWVGLLSLLTGHRPCEFLWLWRHQCACNLLGRGPLHRALHIEGRIA